MIIDIRHQIPWQKRYISNTGTLLLWVFWLLLWQPIMISMGLLSVQKQQIVDHLLYAFFTILENGFTAILVCALVLWLWSHFIPAKSIKYSQVKGMKEYSEHYKIDASIIHSARQQKIVTVHHDESGQISKIE